MVSQLGPRLAEKGTRGGFGSVSRARNNLTHDSHHPQLVIMMTGLCQAKRGTVCASTSQHRGLEPPCLGSNLVSQRQATTPSSLPYELTNAASTYASSASTSLSAYADLPGHHARSTLDHNATSPASTYVDSRKDNDVLASVGFSKLDDPETL